MSNSFSGGVSHFSVDMRLFVMGNSFYVGVRLFMMSYFCIFNNFLLHITNLLIPYFIFFLFSYFFCFLLFLMFFIIFNILHFDFCLGIFILLYYCILRLSFIDSIFWCLYLFIRFKFFTLHTNQFWIIFYEFLFEAFITIKLFSSID